MWLVPVSEVFVASVSGQNLRRITESSDPVRLRELEEHGLACVAVVSSAMVHPVLQAVVAGTDWTHLFAASQAVRRLPSVSDSVTAPVNAVFRLVYVTLKPERRFNGRTLECLATSSGFPPVSATAPVVVECQWICVIYFLTDYLSTTGICCKFDVRKL